MAKRFVALLLALLLLFSLIGCSEEAENQPVAENEVLEQPASAESIAADTEPASETPIDDADKTVLTISGIACINSRLKFAVEAFNKTNSKYRVVINEYGTSANVEQSLLKMQTQLLSGDRPDMLLFEDYDVSSMGEIRSETVSPLPCISSGILLDLDEMIENDPELDADDFVIWDALHEFGGMYLIAPKFIIETVYTLPETAEKYANWTLNDYIRIQNSLDEEQDMFYGMTPQLFIYRIGSRYIHEAVDIENATCDFNNPEFINFLKIACDVKTCNTQDKHIQADYTFKSAEKMMADGELLFSKTWLYTSADIGLQRYNAHGKHEAYDPELGNLKGECGERMAYIGYPTPDGKNGSFVKLITPIGICAGTEHLDGCWEFIRYILENPIYSLYDEDDGTPLLTTKQEEHLNYMIDELETARFPVDQDDQDAFLALARSCTSMSFYDEDIIDIIEDEAEEVFAGAITAETAAERIQNRASILVMERYG